MKARRSSRRNRRRSKVAACSPPLTNWMTPTEVMHGQDAGNSA